jgi:molecular chaperone DnaK
MSITVGIDLGTTNSCIAFHDGREATIIETAEGLRIMPSVVAFKDGGGRLVGRPALTQSRSNAQFSFFNIKRLMGVRHVDGEDHGAHTTRGDDGFIAFVGPDRVYSAPEMSSFLIEAMLDAAEAKLGERPDRAVITIPANFGNDAAHATKEAGRLAGLKEVHLLHEPTAAATAYGVSRSKFTRLAIYDFGGGTFDIALMDVGKKEHTTVTTNGNRHLGGADFDSRIVEYAREEWNKKHSNADLSEEAMGRIRDASEQAKIALSSQNETAISVRYAHTSEKGHHHMSEPLGREQLEIMTVDIIESTLATCQRALTAAGRTREDVDEVILVGGMTRMPAVARAVEAFFGKKPKKNALNPEEVVAIGAATHAAVLDNRISFNLDDRTSMSVGIKATGNAFARVIPKGSPFPTTQSVLVTTSESDQEICTVHIYEGEDHRADKNQRLSHMHVPVDLAPKGEATVEVTFTLDENALLRVDGRILPDGDSFPIYQGRD